MSDYASIKTSPEVWAVIWARHHDELVVFESASLPEGYEFGGGGYMFTAWGFKGGSHPLAETIHTWERRDEMGRLVNEKWVYNLCIPKAGGES